MEGSYAGGGRLGNVESCLNMLGLVLSHSGRRPLVASFSSTAVMLRSTVCSPVLACGVYLGRPSRFSPASMRFTGSPRNRERVSGWLDGCVVMPIIRARRFRLWTAHIQYASSPAMEPKQMIKKMAVPLSDVAIVQGVEIWGPSNTVIPGGGYNLFRTKVAS